jgi:phenylalanyl-tRNA synthetase beta chain
VKVSVDVLRRYTALPVDATELEVLLEDVGLEVKRSDDHATAGTVLTLELLANRGDHHCYEGIAREISGRTGATVSRPAIAPLTVGESPVRLRCETDLCLVYTATLLERNGEGALDADTLLPLVAADIHPVSAPVDATNLSNVELGQPTHAFDADTIVGGIAVRLSRRGERAWPLFTSEPREIPEGLLVIADDEKILAIAGVIGCEESKATDATVRLLLESACFDPVSVRKAGKSLDIHTDACARFERGADPTYPLVGAGRVVHLLERAGWARVGATGLVGEWTDPERDVPARLDRINGFLETSLTADQAMERLHRYGFRVTVADGVLRVRVPPHRLWDVEHWADVAEELLKSIGYNATPTTMRSMDRGALPSSLETAKAKVEQVLLGHDFYEVLTDGFHAKTLDERLRIGPGHPLEAHVTILNAVDRGFSLLKNNALAQALDLLADNQRRLVHDARAYEWTRTFHPDGHSDNGVCSERPLVWAIAVGGERTWSGPARPADVFLMKGLVEEIATDLGLALEVGPWDDALALSSALHPGRRAAIRFHGRTVGLLGEVHPEVVRAFKVRRGSPVYLEIDQAVLAEPGALPRYAAPPEHQPIVRSLAFGLVEHTTAGDVRQLLARESRARVAVTDLFVTGDIRAVTFELTFDNDGKTSADEVNARLATLPSAVESRFPGVKQRA